MGCKKLLMSGALMLVGAAAFAEDHVSQSISFPTGVDVANTITSAIPLLGGVVAVAIAGYTGFLLVRKCFRWIGKALG